MDMKIVEIRLDDIKPNRFQPRLTFDEKALNELAESIKQHGIIQPLVLRKSEEGHYEIIAGERRAKAARLAGLVKVPAVITNIDDNSSAELALVENIQRKNLTAIEEAKSFRNLLDKAYVTQEELAKKMGLSQSAISNKLRLLNLDEEVQEALLTEKISERHARALLQLEDREAQKNWLQKIIKERITVRQLDEELKNILNPEGNNIMDSVINENSNVPTEVPIAPLQPLQEEKFDQTNNLEVNIRPDQEVKVEEAPRKFFSFIEEREESVNMSTEETPVDNLVVSPVVEINPPLTEYTLPKSNPVQEEKSLENAGLPQESVEILDMPMPSLATTVSNQNNQPKEEFLSPYEIVGNESNPQSSIINETQNIVDPVAMIEKLDPEYKSKALEAAGLDLKSAINAIRGYLRVVEDKGFLIDSEEIDLPDVYQIVVNINKNNL